jgi:hypothetical protein
MAQTMKHERFSFLSLSTSLALVWPVAATCDAAVMMLQHESHLTGNGQLRLHAHPPSGCFPFDFQAMDVVTTQSHVAPSVKKRCVPPFFVAITHSPTVQ